MITSIYYYSILIFYTHTTKQSTNTRASNLVSGLKLYTHCTKTLHSIQPQNKRNNSNEYGK